MFAIRNCQNVRTFQNGAVWPVFISRSNGLSLSASANLSEAARATNIASSMNDTEARRHRTGNSSPGRKKSLAGIPSRRSSRRTRPRVAMPLTCDMRLRVKSELNMMSTIAAHA